MTSVTANGVVGYLIYDVAERKHLFRVYDANYDFKDYDIRHSDLRIKIIDPDAHLYETNGHLELDHSPGTLDIE